MLEVVDVAYQGGGMVIAFNDNSTVVAVYKVVNGQLTLEGLTDEQETALELFNDAANVDRLVADPRTNLIFGDDFQYEQREASSSFTGLTGWQDFLEMVTPVLTGTYYIEWNLQGKIEGPNASGDSRIEMRCKNDLGVLGFHQVLNITPASGGPLENIFSGHKVVVFNNESKPFELQFKMNDSGDTATLCRGRLTFWRLR